MRQSMCPKSPARRHPELPEPPPWAEDALYVAVHAGSTGEPKAVVGTHEGLLARARWAAEGPMRMNPSPPEEDEGEESAEGEESELKAPKKSLDHPRMPAHPRRFRGLCD